MVTEMSLLLRTLALEETHPCRLVHSHTSLFIHDAPTASTTMEGCSFLEGTERITLNLLGTGLWDHTATPVVCNWVLPTFPPVWYLAC